MSNDTPRGRGDPSGGIDRRRRRHRLALAAAAVAGLALAGPGSAQLGAAQSQSGSNGALHAVVTNVQVTGNTVQAPVRVVLPIRILSPGEDRGDASATATADRDGSGSAGQSQSGENGALQALLTSIQVVGITAQAPIGLYAPVRVLSPGDDGVATASAGAGGGGNGAAGQSQNGENGTAQAGVTNVQVADNTAQAPVAVTAPI